MNEKREQLVTLIMENCPHYYETIEYVSGSDDPATEALMDFYRNSIYRITITNKAHIRFISELDNLMHLYTTDSNLNDIIKRLMLNDEDFSQNNQITDNLFIRIRKAGKEYTETCYKNVENPIWI